MYFWWGVNETRTEANAVRFFFAVFGSIFEPHDSISVMSGIVFRDSVGK